MGDRIRRVFAFSLAVWALLVALLLVRRATF